MNSNLRSEVAVAAARLVAEEGCDYALAKRRAVRELLGSADIAGSLPDNREIEREVRRHLGLFAADTHPPLLAALRQVAADTMERLARFEPHLIGAVLNGTATEHSDVHLNLYVDSEKDVELYLLQSGVDFDAEEPAAEERSMGLGRLSFALPARGEGFPPSMRMVGIQLHVYPHAALRVAPRGRSDPDSEADLHPVEASGRADLVALRRLLAERAG